MKIYDFVFRSLDSKLFSGHVVIRAKNGKEATAVIEAMLGHVAYCEVREVKGLYNKLLLYGGERRQGYKVASDGT
jgi:hypothetical protein